MKCLVTGGCGFVGAALARHLAEHVDGAQVTAFDSLRRVGSERNRADLVRRGIQVVHGDVRCASDLDALRGFDWVVDAAAEPAVLAGAAGAGVTSRQLMEHNLIGTINVLEAVARWRSGLVFLSTSRVYSIPALAALQLRANGDSYELDAASAALPPGASSEGVDETFSTAPPVSLYGATKIAAEALAFEYASTNATPLVVDRCGVLAGAGQFGKADQGIFSFWIRSWRAGRPLKYIGFEGSGRQVRDCLHPSDLARLVVLQMTRATAGGVPAALNVSGGRRSATSLAQLSEWCARRFGPREVAASAETRPFDLPWVVLDHAKATAAFGWRPEIGPEAIFEEIAAHADANPDWLDP